MKYIRRVYSIRSVDIIRPSARSKIKYKGVEEVKDSE